MRITNLAIYALDILTYMECGKKYNTEELLEGLENITRPTMQKIMKQLAGSLPDHIDSIRGVNGGYILKKTDLTIYDVVMCFTDTKSVIGETINPQIDYSFLNDSIKEALDTSIEDLKEDFKDNNWI